jgi:murein DD-endopeptidase MepM/ murein hydrolase activator NlpD
VVYFRSASFGVQAPYQDRTCKWPKTPVGEAKMLAPIETSPVPNGSFTSGFGCRNSMGPEDREFHSGLDILGVLGSVVVAPVSGTLVHAGSINNGFKNALTIQRDDGTTFTMGHLLADSNPQKLGFQFLDRSKEEQTLVLGQRIKAGAPVANLGSEGKSTGPHVHLTVKTKDGKLVNPLPLFPPK